MILNVNDDQYFETPDAQTVDQELRKLKPDQFAILALAEQDYIQTYHNDDDTYELEYRQGSSEQHFAIADHPASLQLVQETFQAFLNQSENWASAWEWEQIDFESDDFDDCPDGDFYLLNGIEYPKVRIGDERVTCLTETNRCLECDNPSGTFHLPGCEQEECPCCNAKLFDCNCD